MRNYCSNCGTKVEENARFCGNCGHPLTGGKVEDVAEPINIDLDHEHANKAKAKNSGLIMFMVLVVIALIALFAFKGTNGGGNSLVGTWTLQSVNGSTDFYKVGKTITLNSSGKLYDNDNILAYFINDEYTLNSWESASGVLYFSGVFGTSCQARYSLTGNTLTINADGDKLVFRKR